MEFSNAGASVYHKIQAMYVRNEDGQLDHIAGAMKQEIRRAWPLIQPQLLQQINGITNSPKRLECSSEVSHPLLTNSPGLNLSEILVYEIQRQEGKGTLGLLLKSSAAITTEYPFEEFFVSLLLNHMSLNPREMGKAGKPSYMQQQRTDAIVEAFDTKLRHETADDQWTHGGRDYFRERIHHFTSHNARIEFCLPAFPCKSSNPEKVGAAMPDRGEEMALLKLHSFVECIESIYKPGAKVWIISDGHVFSDCIGVDDDTVDQYGAKLIEMNQVISTHQGSHDRVGFKSLVDLFGLTPSSAVGANAANDLQIPEISHFLNTTVSEEAELCRRILMSGCQSDKALLRRKIDSQNPSTLALYRGFSRFMLEDLDLHPFTRSISRSQRKKLAAKVSFEMIMRNQAYSNLVDILLPDHVRLSIHAHNNSGPKFGIELFDTTSCSAASSFLPSIASETPSADLLHIPTPWHSCVFQFADHPHFYITKSKVVHDALGKGIVTGRWIEGGAGKGGYFALERLAPTSPPQTPHNVGSTISAHQIGVRKMWKLPANMDIWSLRLLHLAAYIGRRAFSLSRW